jgi:hemolysin III
MKRFTLHKNESFTKGEELSHAISHGIGVILGIAALVLLVLRAESGIALTGGIIFGVSIVSLYLMSTIYHALRPNTKIKEMFERFDHMFIYVLIGGTFAPALLLAVAWPLGIVFFIVQWSIIAIALLLKIFFFHKFHHVHVIAYLVLGWSAVFIVPALFQTSPESLVWLGLGGLAYSIGVFFYAFRSVRYMHLVWHLLVLAGTTFHFMAIYFYIV